MFLLINQFAQRGKGTIEAVLKLLFVEVMFDDKCIIISRTV
jgi:hypothetical protein